jgi:GrpB-like predicted nucleotidyltransferase (UPF0157 family)
MKGSRVIYDSDAMPEREAHAADAVMLIGAYTPSPVEYLPQDPECRRVAGRIAALIMESNGNLEVDHIGSTSVPGCWGKGIVDLLVQYHPGGLAAARDSLDRLGFQRQGGHDAFPESRPMRVGGAKYFGRLYRIHAHVIERGSAEAGALVRFRDLLRQNIRLRCAYECEKRSILARGVIRGSEYSNAKSEFIRRVLAADRTRSTSIDDPSNAR